MIFYLHEIAIGGLLEKDTFSFEKMVNASKFARITSVFEISAQK